VKCFFPSSNHHRTSLASWRSGVRGVRAAGAGGLKGGECSGCETRCDQLQCVCVREREREREGEKERERERVGSR
jgi:hypothetical protein